MRVDAFTSKATPLCKTETPAWKAIVISVITATVLGCGGGGGSGGGTGNDGTTVQGFGPVAISATAASDKITISWQDIPGAKYYNVYWSINAQMTKETATKVEVSQSPFIHTPIVQGATNYYLVAAVNANGVESPISNMVQIQSAENLSPAASFSAPAAIIAGGAATIDASSSTDDDGTIASYTYNFGDGTPTVTQKSPLITHTYLTRGTFVMSVTATDNFGAASTTSKEITVGLLSQPAVNVSSTSTNSGGGVAAADLSGKVGIMWQEYGATAFAVSTDGGTTFTKTKEWGQPGYQFSQHKIVASNGEFYLTWTVFPALRGAEIAFARSNSGGSLFSDPVIVSTIDELNSYVPSIAVQGSKVAIVWSDTYIGIGGPPGGITYTHSSDGGGTFSNPTKVAGPGSCPNIVLANGRTYLAWADNVTESVLFSSSIDGTNFSPPKQVPVTAQKASCPDMKVDSSGTIFILWTQGSTFEKQKVMLAVSTDSGASFSTPFAISDPSLDSGFGTLAIGPDNAVIASWSTGETYDNSAKTFLVYSADHGTTFSPAMKITALDGESSYARIISKQNRDIGVVWEGPLRLPQDGVLVSPDIFYATVVVPR